MLINGQSSEQLNLSWGVPQGSVLGPILFTIYTTPLANIIRKHGLTFHLYADDTQLYLAFKPSSELSKLDAKDKLESCVEDIRTWMSRNLLKLNDDKTEVIIITSKEKISSDQNISINVGGCDIHPSAEPPRNLGVLFDSTCSLKYHVNKQCKSLNFNIYKVGKIRKYLDRPTSEILVNSLFTSTLDYCNSLLYGVYDYQIAQLQRCQNSAARVISLTRKFDHITHTLHDLHWLPVKFRIRYKMLLITYKSLNNQGPAYLKQLLEYRVPARSPRLAERAGNDRCLKEPSYRLPTFGGRSFQSAAPRLWNSLPDHLRHEQPGTNAQMKLDNFKRALKTHLFAEYYYNNANYCVEHLYTIC